MSMPDKKNPYLLRTALTLGWLAAVVLVIVIYRPQFWYPAVELYKQAVDDAAAGRDQDALINMREALASEPDNPGFLIFTGNLELQVGRSDLALETFQRAVSHNEQSFEARLGLAKALAMQGRSREALRELNQMASRKLTWVERRRMVGLYALAGDKAAALDQLKKILAADKNPDRALLQQALALAAANNQWNYLLSLPTDPLLAEGDVEQRRTAADQKAVALRAVGKYRQAYELFKKNPSKENLEARAELALQLELYPEAVELLGQLQNSRPSDARVSRMAAYALQKAGQAERAESEYAKLYNSGKADKKTLVRYVWLLNQQGKYDQAWKVMQRLDESEDDVDLLDLRARTSYWAGDMDSAARLIAKLLDKRKQL